MRLTPEEIEKLILAVNEFLEKNTAELRLFGSRTDDRKKGGDIDLLLLTHDAETCEQLQIQKYNILVRMKELIGDQKIDLKIAEKKEIATDPFLQIIYPDSITLKIW